MQAWILPSLMAVGLTVFTPFVAGAVTVPFVEDFTANAANWADNTGLAFVDHVPSGGPDGSAFVSTNLAPIGFGGVSVVLFRGQEELNSSGGAFVGDWIGEGVDRFTAYVRHNAPQPLNFFTRFSGPGNFPGAVAVRFAPVLPNTWTLLDFDIHPSNPAFVTFEGTSFAAVFSNIGHVQVGVSVPETLDAVTTAFTFDLDAPSITAIPEPATRTAALGLVAVAAWRRRDRRIANR